MAWAVNTTATFREWFEKLTRTEQIELASLVELLEQFGPALKRPHADTLTGSKFANMKELRGKTATAVLRVAFAFDPKREAVLLVGGDKTGVNERKFYKALIAAADSLYRAHLDGL